MTPQATTFEPAALTILVVDDDPLVAVTMNAVLTDLGHRCHEADGARTALEWLAGEGPVDVLITDYAMPGMSGLQLAREVQMRWPTTAIILASGFAELPESTDPSILVLSKPYDRAALIEAVHTVVNQPRT
jgi:CheY-like chemotaxis protein